MSADVQAQAGRSKQKKRLLIGLGVAVLVAALVAGGIIAGVILLHRPGPAKLPRTASELSSSIRTAERYLTSEGKELARGKTEGATVYSVNARLDTANDAVTGDEVVLFTNRTGDDLGEIVFRVYPNGSDIRGEKGEPVSISEARVDGGPASFKLKGSLLSVRLPDNLKPQGRALVEFQFTEHVPEISGDITGLLGGSAGGYGIFGHGDNVYNLGHFLPTIASYRDGRWENREIPAFGDIADYECSYYTVAFEAPGKFVTVGTGIELAERKGGSGTVHTFVGGPVRDFEIQASPDYKMASSKVGGTVVSSYYIKGAGKSGAKALEVGKTAIEQYSRHFGPYPYTRFNLCEAPLAGGAAGMEFTGQVLLGQILYGDLGLGEGLSEGLEDLGGLEDLMNLFGGGLVGDTLEFVIAHEVGHQWWGLGVGSDSIGHPWQDEALTNYSAVLYYRWVHGEEAADKEMELQLVMPYSAAGLFGGGDTVVDSPIDKFENQEQYMAVAYSKGALFFNELYNQMGAEAFDRSLSDYYHKYVFLNAMPEDLTNSFEANSKDPGAVAALYQRWIKEVHGDEDIAGGIPGLEGLEELLKDFGDKSGLDLGPLEDLLKEFMDQGGKPPENEPLPNTEPSQII